MNILITGGIGFIGTNLGLKLLQEGHTVTAHDNFYTSTEDNLQLLREYEKFDFEFVDIRDSEYVKTFSHNDYEIIFHLACPASPPQYQKSLIYTHEVATLGTRNVLQLGNILGSNIVYASTSEIYGDPQVDIQQEVYRGNVNTVGIRSCYDEGKRIGETFCHDYNKELGTKAKIARIFNTYGPYMNPEDGRILINFITQALKGAPLTIYGDGTQTRSMCYVSDMLDGLIKLANSDDKLNALPINLGNPQELTVNEIANKVLRLTDSKSEKIYLPLPSDDPRKRKPDIDCAKRLLGWEPKIDLGEGIVKMVNYVRSKYKY